MANTGYKKYTRRIEIFVDDNGNPLPDQPTGKTEPNTEFLPDGSPDPNYIPHVLDCANCGDDQIDPTAPTNLVASNIEPTTLTLSWDGSQDTAGNCPSGIAGYNVYKSGSLFTVTTGTGTTVNLTGLTPATASTWTVKAYDNAGNISAPSNSVSVYQPKDIKAFNTSLVGSNADMIACGDTVATARYHDGTGQFPMIGDFIYTNSDGSTIFNGNDKYYKIMDEERSIVIDSFGEVIDKLDCN